MIQIQIKKKSLKLKTTWALTSLTSPLTKSRNHPPTLSPVQSKPRPLFSFPLSPARVAAQLTAAQSARHPRAPPLPHPLTSGTHLSALSLTSPPRARTGHRRALPVPPLRLAPLRTGGDLLANPRALIPDPPSQLHPKNLDGENHPRYLASRPPSLLSPYRAAARTPKTPSALPNAPANHPVPRVPSRGFHSHPLSPSRSQIFPPGAAAIKQSSARSSSSSPSVAGAAQLP